MGKINIHNYEKYAIDYLEGNLDAETKSQFELFLAENPDIAEELTDLEPVTLSRPHIIFENKENLKKSEIDDISYVEYLVISEIEGLATDEDKKELKRLIETDSKIKSTYEQYQKTKLTPYPVIFEEKEKLKKKKIATLPSLSAIAVAASLILMFWIFGNTNKIKQDALFAKMTTFVSFPANKPQKESLLAKMPDLTSITEKNIATNQTIVSNNIISHTNNQIEQTDTLSIQQNVIIAEEDYIAPKQIKVLKNLPNPDIEYLKVSNTEMQNDKRFIEPVKLANTVIDVYKYATENTDLNMKICYNKEDKSLCLAYKNKDYVVVFE